MTETDTNATTTDVPTDNGGADLDFDAPTGADATIVTQGDPARSLLKFLNVLVDEAKFRFSPDGISITAVDPANVGMVDFDAPAASFSGFDAPDDLVIGMPLTASTGGGLKDALSFARKGRKGQNGDPVRIDVFDDDQTTRVRVAVIRPDQQVKRVSEFFAIDPDSIRQEPDIPTLNLPNQAQPDLDGFQAAVKDLKRNHDHVWFGRTGPTLVIGSQPTPNPTLANADEDVVDTVEFPNAAWSDDDSDSGQGSIFSMDYLADFTGTMSSTKADRVIVRFGDEIPLKMDLDWTDWGFEGQLMLAPRIMSDGD